MIWIFFQENSPENYENFQKNKIYVIFNIRKIR